jgi:hypothetical protein
MLYNLFPPEVKYRLPITIKASVAEPKYFFRPGGAANPNCGAGSGLIHKMPRKLPFLLEYWYLFSL